MAVQQLETTPSVASTSFDTNARDRAIDVIRGLCLLSMTTGHLLGAVAARSTTNELLHLPLYVDGAAGFVFLSGVSLALADAGRARRGESSRNRAGWMLQRAGVIYLVHVLVTLVLAIALGPRSTADTSAPDWTEPFTLDVDGIVDVLTFSRSVKYADILPMYVVFLVAAAAVTATGSRRVRDWAIVMSAFAYPIALVHPEWSALHSADGTVAWVLGAWQVLFVLGFVAGHNWSEIRRRLSGVGRRPAAVLAAATVAAMGSLRLLAAVSGGVAWLDEELLAKPLLELPRLLFAVGMGTGAYLVVDAVVTRRPRLVEPLTVIGSRSLRVYVASCLALVPTWRWVGPAPGRPTAELMALGAMAGCLIVALPRTRWRGTPWSI